MHDLAQEKGVINILLLIEAQSPLSLMKKKAWHLKKKLNIDLMKQGLLILKKNKDFSTFRSSSCSAKISNKNFR